MKVAYKNKTMPLGRYNTIAECRSTFCETTPNRTWKHFKVHYIFSGQTPKLSAQVKQTTSHDIFVFGCLVLTT